jgi:HNH endonuclease
MQERPVDEMAFKRYRLPMLIGQGGLGRFIAAAAAALALASFSVLATAPGVAQASPPVPRTIPVVVAAYGEPTPHAPPWWHAALHYGVLVIAVCFVAWLVHRSKLWSAPVTASALWPPRRAFGRDGFAGVLMARKRMALLEAGYRCAIPTCRHPTHEIAHILPESQSHDDSFTNLIALCPKCQNKEIDRQAIRGYKRNLAILNSRYSDFERRVFDQIAETDQRSFIVEAGFEILLAHAVNDGLLKRVEPTPAMIQRGEPTQHKYEVTDEGLVFINRYVCGEDLSEVPR